MVQHVHPLSAATLALTCFLLLIGCTQTTQQQPSITPGPLFETLPECYTERVPMAAGQYAQYEMVLIPGSADGRVAPFYIGRTEVTWDMFMEWCYGTELSSREHVRLIDMGLRPSIIGMGHPQIEYGWANDEKGPAVGLSWQTARAYCIWLTAVTGRSYRLPTDTEWQHVFELSGGVPNDERTLLSRAVLQDNAELHEIIEFAMPRTVAQGEPDALGLYDLLGNAAEWVQPMAGRRWVRGGHFDLPADAFTPDWRAFEDQEVWNASYPQLPYSRHWYIDHVYQGIRLVCEVEQPRP